jgi:polyisoprenoid-binding protein YceI
MAKWVIDPDHSVAAFSIRHMMIANVRGQFNKITGNVYYDPPNIAASSVEMTIDVSSLVTGIQKRDEHLKSPDFFDAKKYPVITFKSTKIEHLGGSRAKVIGNLSIHGVSRTVILEVEYSGPVKDPFESGMSMGFTAETLINKEDYGIKWNYPMEGSGVVVWKDAHINIDIEADLAE